MFHVCLLRFFKCIFKIRARVQLDPVSPSVFGSKCVYSLGVHAFQQYNPLNKEIKIIIITMSRRQHRYPWPSLVISPYHSSLLAGLQGYIPYPHIAAVCMFELVVQLLLGHMRGSIGVYHWSKYRILYKIYIFNRIFVAFLFPSMRDIFRIRFQVCIAGEGMNLDDIIFKKMMEITFTFKPCRYYCLVSPCEVYHKVNYKSSMQTKWGCWVMF